MLALVAVALEVKYPSNVWNPVLEASSVAWKADMVPLVQLTRHEGWASSLDVFSVKFSSVDSPHPSSLAPFSCDVSASVSMM